MTDEIEGHDLTTRTNRQIVTISPVQSYVTMVKIIFRIYKTILIRKHVGLMRRVILRTFSDFTTFILSACCG